MNKVEHSCNNTTTIDSLEEAKNKALIMLEEGVCCSVIAKCTGLSKEEIKKLNNHVCDH